MKKIILASILALVLSVVFIPLSNAQIAKEGTATVTVTFTATSSVVPLDLDGPDKDERFSVTGEVLGVILSDTGKGPFHNMSLRGIFIYYYDKGVAKMLGYGIWTDPDGDKVFEQRTGEPPKTTGRFLDGTGKFAGIEGGTEVLESIELKPSKEGAFPTVGLFKIHWKLP